jgi:hypothetical protein
MVSLRQQIVVENKKCLDDLFNKIEHQENAMERLMKGATASQIGIYNSCPTIITALQL